jgi:hypothetical protein
MSVAEVVAKNFPIATDKAIFASNALDAIDITGTDTVGGLVANAAGDEWEMGFLIRGTAGSTTINLTVTRRWRTVVSDPYDATLNPTGAYVGKLGIGNLWDHDGDGGAVTAEITPGTADLVMTVNTAAGDPSDVITIRLFDSNNDTFNGLWDHDANPATPDIEATSQAGWWEKATTAPYAYVDYIEPEDNVLCITTNLGATLVNGQYVWATPDSQPGTVAGSSQVSFSGDYTIANISGSEGYTVQPVGKGICETVTIGTSFDQYGNPIGDETTLDVGDYDDGGCTGSRWSDQVNTCETGDGFGVLISKSSNFGAADAYRLELSLAVSSDGGSTYTDIDGDDAWFAGDNVAYETSASNVGNAQCSGTAADATTAMNLTTNETDNTDSMPYIQGSDYTTVLSNTYDSYLIDVGTIGYLKSAFAAGDIIALKVVVYKFPCGLVATEYVCLATAVAQCPTSGGGTSYTVFYPYGVGANNAQFWSGIAVVNTSSVDGTAVATFYGDLGGQSAYTVDVPARGMVTFSMGQIMSDPAMVGTLTGDENWQCSITADTTIDGVTFVGGKGAYEVLHGYLPRMVTP